MNSNTAWLVIAQKAEARVYEVDKAKSIQLIQEFSYPSARMKNHEFGCDRPARSFSSGGSSRHNYALENGIANKTIDFLKAI